MGIVMDFRPVKKPNWQLIYNGVDYAPKINPYCLSVCYTDPLEGEAAEVEIALEDKDDWWKNEWLPQKGATITLRIGYEGEPLLQCGEFQLDELEFSGPPDTVTIRTMAAGINPALRSARSVAYENTTLAAIAAKIAKRHGLTIVGTVPENRIQRITQHKESDLAFLRRIAAKWGHVFSVRGKKLVWHDQEALDNAPSVITITRKMLAGSYEFRSKSARIYRACRVTYWNQKLKKDVTRTITIVPKGAQWGGSGDTLTLVERCESLAQAKQKAKAAIRRANGRQTEGFITIFGERRLIAGVNLTTSGWGKLDGDYQIVKSIHRIDRSGGYVTTVDFGLNGTYGMGRNTK